MADWDKWDGQSWYRNNKNRPSGVGTVSHARREKMRQKALAREAAEALAKRDQAAADAAATPAATDAATPAATNAATPAATAASAAAPPSSTGSSSSSSSSSTTQVGAKRAKKEPEQSLDKRDVKEECESLDKRDEKKKDEKKKINLLAKGMWEMSHRGLGGQVPGEPHQPHHHQSQGI